jgi:hypothetical protein
MRFVAATLWVSLISQTGARRWGFSSASLRFSVSKRHANDNNPMQVVLHETLRGGADAVDVVAATVEELYLPGLLDALVTRNEKVSISGL